MKRDTKKKWRKIVARKGRFSLFQSICDPTIWEVSFKSLRDQPSARKYLRKRFSAERVEAALDAAKEITGDRGFKVFRRFTLGESFSMCLQSVAENHCFDTTRMFRYWVKRFFGWIAEKRPECRYWDMLDCSIIEDYLKDHKGTSKRHPLEPIRQTTLYMARRYKMANFLSGFRARGKLKNTPASVYLTDVLAFVDYLKDRGELRFETGAALQGLAGLQLQEALRLTWAKVDMDRGLIEISGEVKNCYRNRVIPIHRRIRETLVRARAASESSNVIDLNAPVVPSPTGMFYGMSWLNYSHSMKKLMLAWNPAVRWKPKDLRNCLPTFAAISGVTSAVWEQYIGHAPQGITAMHYVPRLASGSLGEKEALDQQMEIFRKIVVQTLENARVSWQILNYFKQMNES